MIIANFALRSINYERKTFIVQATGDFFMLIKHQMHLVVVANEK
jgi:hypothetical protein